MKIKWIINENELFFKSFVTNTSTEIEFPTFITGHLEHGVIAKVP